MKRVKAVAIICVLTLALGTHVNAKEVDNQRLSEYSGLSVGGYDIVSGGKLTGEMPQNVSYDMETNVLTLNNFYLEDDSDEFNGISANEMGDDFTIRLEGENTLDVLQTNSYYGLIDSGWGNLTIEGPGILNLFNVSFIGIQCMGDLTIENCTINMTGDSIQGGYFYGISGSTYDETETLINESQINISNVMASGSQAANAGIDVQDGNLSVRNSKIDIQLENGNIFGLAAGQTDEYGGRLTIDNSTVECMTSTDIGNRYNHNMYFYEMADPDSLYYYVQDGDSFIQKTFDEAFEFEKYLAGRYDSNYGSTVISSIPLEEYCSHEWDDGKVTISPSCENTGKKEYTCTKCNETKIETIPALGHEWKEWEIVKEATCTEDGVRIRTCSRCNDTDTESIPQLGHDFEVKIVKEPTCTESGIQEKVCSRCGFAIENESISATGHDYEWIVEKEATFHDDGLKKGTCNKCGDVITERIPKLSESHKHEFSGKEVITKPATCTSEGSKNIYCTEPECGEFITEVIPMTEHALGEWTTVKDATCAENGLEEKNCTVCGKVIETRITDKIPHTYEEWEITTEPTCTEAGVETSECTVCGEETVRGINPLGHNYVEWEVTKEATCTENGEESSACVRCGEITARVIAAEGHSFGEWEIVKEATLNSEGERQAVCSKCGEIKIETIPKLSDLQSSASNGNVKDDDTIDNNIDSSTPQTGDQTSVLIYLISLSVTAAIALIVVMRKINKKNM